MKFTSDVSKISPELKMKAQADVENFLIQLRRGSKWKLFGMTQLSWRKNHKRRNLEVTASPDAECLKIHFHSFVRISALISFTSENSELMQIMFTAEKKPYVTDVTVPYRWNPSSQKPL